jgi:hypothetical protein
MRRDGSQVSAHTAMAAVTDPVARIHRANEDYLHSVGAGAEHLAGPEVMARIDRAAANIDETGTGVCFTDCAAWPVLRQRLAVLAIEGRDPVVDLRDATDMRPLGDARDKAAVVEWRLSEGAMEQRSTGPLSWLPRIPDPLATHPQWGPYLAERSKLVSELAEQIRAAARLWDNASAPAWARPLLGRPGLLAELAVFRAAHDIDPADSRVTGPKQHRVRSAKVQREFNKQVDKELTYAHPGIKRWQALAQQIDIHIPRDPYWPQLAVRLDDAAKAGADVAQLLNTAMSQGPLPDELPAAALWWRLYGTLAPPSLDGGATQLRPPWTAELHRLFGTPIAEAIVTDPAWPALVASVTASGWPPHELLSVAAEHLLDIATTEGLRPDQYARLLTYRVQLLTHHAAMVDRDIPHPAEHVEPAGEHLIAEDDVAQEELYEQTAALYDYADEVYETDVVDPEFADLPSSRSAQTADEDVDIPALRARRDDAHRRAQELAEAILRGPGGPAEQTATTTLAELRAYQDVRRPYQERLAQAHTDWVRAEDRAQLHRQLIERLDAQITAQCADSRAVEQLQRHRADAAQQTDRITAGVDAAWARLNGVRSALVEAPGGAENIVSERDITELRERALRADRDALAAARAEVSDLDTRLARAEIRAARAFAEAETRRAGFVAEHIELLRAELGILTAAAVEVDELRVRIPASRLAGLSDATKKLLPKLARLPFSVIPVRALPGEDTDRAVHTLERAATVAGRQVLQCSPTSDLDIPEPKPEHRWERVQTYTYYAGGGRPVQQVIREECQCDGVHKRFLQRYRDGGRNWIWEKPPNFTPVLYRAPELARADHDEWVWLCEGEKDADTAASLGLVATTNAQGAGSFAPELVGLLADRRVAVVIDRDAAGYKRAATLHEQLSGVAREIRFLLPATAEAKSDFTDHVRAGLWDASLPFGGMQETTRDAVALRAQAAA